MTEPHTEYAELRATYERLIVRRDELILAGVDPAKLLTPLPPLPSPGRAILAVADPLKMVRETLCVAQAAVGLHTETGRRVEHIARLQRLIDECDRHRPLGLDGKHGNRHTPTCGCEDKRYGIIWRTELVRLIEHGLPCIHPILHQQAVGCCGPVGPGCATWIRCALCGLEYSTGPTFPRVVWSG